jgi:hypothetical protein
MIKQTAKGINDCGENLLSQQKDKCKFLESKHKTKLEVIIYKSRKPAR